MIRSKTVWAIYTNLGYNEGEKFYERNRGMTSNDVKFALVNKNGIEKIIDKEPFMKKGGSVLPTDAIDYVLWPKMDSLYVYNDFFWESTVKFNFGDYKPVNWDYILNDNKGKLWYFVQKNYGKLKIASFEIATSEKKLYFPDDTSGFIALNATKEGNVIAETRENFYLKNGNDTSWTKILKRDLGLDSTFNYSYRPFVIDDSVYIFSIYDINQLRKAVIVNLNTGKKYFPASNNLQYEGLGRVEIDKFGKGVFRGVVMGSGLVLKEPYIYEADSAWVQLLPKLATSNPTIKLAEDGHIYFNQWNKWDGTEFKKSFLTTFLGNDIIFKDLGFTKKLASVVDDFECINNEIYILGYYPDKYSDTLIPNITIHDLETKQNINYDITNSDLKKYNYTNESNWNKITDEVPRHITADKSENIWILTTKNLQKFKDGKIARYELPYKNNYHSFYNMDYDANSNELLFSSVYQSQIIYYFSIGEMKLDSFLIENTGIKGQLVKYKKLLDNNIWASDSEGYLYRYQGKGKFKSVDLKINGYENLRFPINDFCIDPNNNMHLATEIGLLTNPDFITGVQENTLKENEDISISPNPTSDYINVDVSFLRMQESEIMIYNIFGECVLTVETQCIASLQRIDVSTLPEGIYFVRIGEKIGKFVVVR
jgi:hypothetical protein